MQAVKGFGDLPQQAQDDVRAQGGDERSTKGVFHRGAMYLVRENHSSIEDLQATIAHELIGHYGTRQMLGPDFVRKANMLLMQFGGIDGLRARLRSVAGSRSARPVREQLVSASKENPTRFTDDIVRLILTEEVFSHSAEKPMFLDRIKSLIGMVRAWLRSTGLFEPADLNESDMLYLIGQSRAVLKGQRAPEQAGMDVSVLRRPMASDSAGQQQKPEKPSPSTASSARPQTGGQPIAQTEEGFGNFWKWFRMAAV